MSTIYLVNWCYSSYDCGSQDPIKAFSDREVAEIFALDVEAAVKDYAQRHLDRSKIPEGRAFSSGMKRKVKDCAIEEWVEECKAIVKHNNDLEAEIYSVLVEEYGEMDKSFLGCVDHYCDITEVELYTMKA